MKFVADVMLGRLARFMRFRGYDVEYDRRIDDSSLLLRSKRKLLLTKDRELAARSKNAYLVKSIGAEKQLEEIQNLFPVSSETPRCLLCNKKIRQVKKETIQHLVPPFVFRRYNNFYKCSGCSRIYWPGTHYKKMSSLYRRPPAGS